MITVRVASPDDVDGCVDVLARLPDFFTPDTHDEVRAAFPDDRAWVAADDDGAVIGFVLARQRYERTAEILYAAVVPEHRGAGNGTALVERAVADLAATGVRLVEVKTLDASAGYEPYVATRAFWAARGFDQIDCIDPLPGWQPGNPSAILVAALAPTREDPPATDGA